MSSLATDISEEAPPEPAPESESATSKGEPEEGQAARKAPRRAGGRPRAGAEGARAHEAGPRGSQGGIYQVRDDCVPNLLRFIETDLGFIVGLDEPS